MLDLGALREARLGDPPHRWGYLRQALGAEAARALRETFPGSGYWSLRRHDGEKAMDLRLRCLVALGGAEPAGADSLPPAWRAFTEELLSDGYRDAFAEALGISLDDHLLEVSAWRWPPDAFLDPHVDLERKLASQVFYFNDGWDPDWGGCLDILGSEDPEDVVARLPPALGSASIVVRSDSSWHAVQRVRAAAREERLSVIATWQHPGTESPFWTVDPDGTVRCHARGSEPVALAA